MLEIDQLRRDFKLLQDRLVQLETHNINLRRRRITNASPAIDSNDYVIKADLDTLEERIATAKPLGNRPAKQVTVVESAKGFSQLDFFVDHTLAILANASQQIYLADDFVVGSYLVAVKIAPTGLSIEFTVKVNGVSVLTGTLGDGLVTSGVISQEATLSKNVPITVDITKVGSTFPGRDFSLSLRATD